MVLLDSVYINESGGKVLLDYLIKNIEIENINCFYLFDDRCINEYPYIPNDRKIFLKASLLNRHRFYIKNSSKFSKVFCFGNLPPTVKLEIPVITYFHQPLFLDVPSSVSLLNKIKIKMKVMVLNAIKSNTNIWFVQSEHIGRRLILKYGIKKEQVKIIPFYPPIPRPTKNYSRRKDGFVYISNGGIHKNHSKLIEAFCRFFDLTQTGVLHITVSAKFPELIELIENKISVGYPIVNHGFISRNGLLEIYQTNEFLVFPSLAESFGLGLVEAIENGCKVIGADLPYTHSICTPSLVFNPLEVIDLQRAFIESQSDNVKETKQLVFNQITQIIKYLKS